MVDVRNIIQISDAILDCIPFLSTLSNGIELLWKLARKVDATANPVNPSWKNDIKLHLISKSKIECLTGMIPIFDDIVSC